jgi:hypothetical protein
VFFEKTKDLFLAQEKYTAETIQYFVFKDKVSNMAYSSDIQNINILLKTGALMDVARASDHFNLQALTSKVTNFYICHPKK